MMLSHRLAIDDKFKPLRTIVQTSSSTPKDDISDLLTSDTTAITFINAKRQSLHDHYELAKLSKPLKAHLDSLSAPLKAPKGIRSSYEGAIRGLYWLYKAVKMVYVSMWFYTAPYLAIILQFWLIDEQLERGNRLVEIERREELQTLGRIEDVALIGANE